MKAITKPRISIALGVFVVASVVIAAATGGITKASVPKGDVATITGQGDVTQAQFNRAMSQIAKQGSTTSGGSSSTGCGPGPQPGDPTYTQARDQALGNLLQTEWIQGEAKSLGIEVSDRQVQDALSQFMTQQKLKTPADFAKFAASKCFTVDEAKQQFKVGLLSQQVQQKIAARASKVSDSDVSQFYNQNQSQFKQPEQRDIRVILNKDRAKVEQAQRLLQADNSPANWSKVAKQYSTDASSKDKGGVRGGITPGVLEGNLGTSVFAAPTGQVSSVVQTPLGFYVFQVDKVTPATTQPLSAVQAQLKQQLQAQAQQQALSTFVTAFRAKWTDRTICADGYVISDCDNFKGTETPCTAQQAKTTGCPPWVQERNPIAPGTVQAGPLASSSGAPQRPHPPGAATASPTTGLPGGIGAPGATPGATASPTGR